MQYSFLVHRCWQHLRKVTNICDTCNLPNSAEHVLIARSKYENKRKQHDLTKLTQTVAKRRSREKRRDIELYHLSHLQILPQVAVRLASKSSDIRR